LLDTKLDVSEADSTLLSTNGMKQIINYVKSCLLLFTIIPCSCLVLKNKKMKKYRKLLIVSLLFGFLFSTSSCLIIPRRDGSKSSIINSKGKSNKNHPRKNRKNSKIFKMIIEYNSPSDFQENKWVDEFIINEKNRT
jgi:hypothetical protein